MKQILVLLIISSFIYSSDIRWNFGIVNSYQIWNYLNSESHNDAFNESYQKIIDESLTPKLGFKIGLEFQKELLNNLVISISINYTQRGSKSRLTGVYLSDNGELYTDDNKEIYSLEYFEFPISMKYRPISKYGLGFVLGYRYDTLIDENEFGTIRTGLNKKVHGYLVGVEIFNQKPMTIKILYSSDLNYVMESEDMKIKNKSFEIVFSQNLRI